MELKDFVKGVIFDITNAIKECQEELDNGTIVSPTSVNPKEDIKTSDGYLHVSSIEFEVSVTASSSNEVGGKITVLSALTGGAENKSKDENISKIKFSIPLVYPCSRVKTLPRNSSHPVY